MQRPRRPHRQVRLRLAFAVCAAGMGLGAAPKVAHALDLSTEPVLAEWWEEPPGPRPELHEVAGKTFERFPPGIPNLGRRQNSIWLRVRLHHPGNGKVTRIVSLAWPRIEKVEAFALRERSEASRPTAPDVRALGISGWDIPATQRPLPAASHNFPVELAHGDTSVYLRVTSTNELILPVLVNDWPNHIRLEKMRTMGGAAYTGVLFALACFNVLVFLRLRQRYHLLYALSVFSFLVWWLTNAGWLSFFAGGFVPFEAVILIAGAAWHACRVAFSRDFLQLERVAPRLDRLMSWIQWAIAPVVVLQLLLMDNFTREVSSPFFQIPLGLCTLVAGYVAFRRRVRMARWFLPGTVLLNSGLLLGFIIFGGAGMLHPIYAGASIMLGMGGELIVLTLALAERAREVVEQREQVLREATTHRLSSLEKLVAGVTHEFNSPLGTLRSAADSFDTVSERLQDVLPDTAPRGALKAAAALKPLSASSRAATDRLDHVLRSLRTFARLDEASEERVDLSEGLKSALVLLEPEMSGSIEVTAFLPELPPVQCRATELNQAFMAVLTNAVEAMPEGGHLGVRAVAEPDAIEVEVEDTGSGIPLSAQAQLFEPQLVRRGRRVKMGLGLSTAKGVLDAHDGSIHVSSVPGEGTRVTMRVPRR